MGRSKLKQRLKQKESMKEEPINTDVPISNLPKKFVWMHVKSGTKIKNILEYALKEFPTYNSIVWTGVGQGIAKAISCAEIFKRKHEALHQVTKLRYNKLEKSKEDTSDKDDRIPEIHILLTKNIEDITETGYQAPGDRGEFPDKEDAMESKMSSAAKSSMNSIDTEQFAAMGLKIKRSGQKRQQRGKCMEPSLKKNKKTNPD